ncbi:MAG TPA: alginate lyase family protein [Acidobacteriaceae bacterium]
MAAVALREAHATTSNDAYDLVAKTDRARVIAAANRYLSEQPVTVTAAHSDRSSGGAHDYFSEGDYWWPDAKNPGGPYIRRDGFSNPANFNTHREALIRLSLIAPALAAAWRLTKDKRYAAHFVKHLRAWFVDPATKMNPNLEYAQAIFGVSKGRGTGIIDTLHLVEVVRAMRVLEAAHGITAADVTPIRAWFADYVNWMATSANGKEEEAAKNNHGTCWVLQVAEFSQFARRSDLTVLCIDRFLSAIVPDQIAKDGRLPLELARTKPYSYSLFDADVLSGICQSLAAPHNDLWRFKGPNGAGVGDVVAFLFPYIADKSKWPFPKDVEHFDDFPARRPCLLFAGEALAHPEYIDVWRRLDADPIVPEVIRNMPIRQPLLWVDPVLRA